MRRRQVWRAKPRRRRDDEVETPPPTRPAADTRPARQVLRRIDDELDQLGR